MNISNPDKTVKCWVELYSDSLYSWAFYKTSDAATAEDLVQDTFLSAFQSIRKFEGKSAPKTWLLSILNNKIADHFRKTYTTPLVIGSEQMTDYDELTDRFFDADGNWKLEQRPVSWPIENENLLDDASFVKILQICMDKLPAHWNAAIRLKYLEEKEGGFICQELQIAPTNFWQILHRAKLQLRKCLEIHWFKKEL